MNLNKLIPAWLLGIIGLTDSIYLTINHYQSSAVFCSTGFSFIDCGQVLKSSYSELFGIPLSLLGILFYFFILFILGFIYLSKNINFKIYIEYILIFLSFSGFIFSLYLLYLQAYVIHSFCLYCLLSAVTSTLLFLYLQAILSKTRKKIAIYKTGFLYRNLVKPICFKIHPEIIHNNITLFGQNISKYKIAINTLDYLYKIDHPTLSQKISGISFDKPVGLSAGFDYEAKLTQVLPSLDFGFATVGTITNQVCPGNPSPQLGRLPRSKSLMVNKGFKNKGADKTIKILKDLHFDIPIGISVGRTNTNTLKTQKESIRDITQAFIKFEKAKLTNKYYELNISCPNLRGGISFYPEKNLQELLKAIDSLKIKKPIFVKMPITESDKHTLKMLEIISRHSPSGVIIGNLQKDRQNSSLDQQEVKMFSCGNFSGKPTYHRSNQLISLTYKHYRDKLTIIGCGGVFSPEDAFTKIALGASLVQLITGLIYQGPQLVSQINFGLEKILLDKGLKNISQAIGINNK